MEYFLIGISLFFGLVGYAITPNNAKYLLLGYNTMSKEQREEFQLEAFLRLFKKFHLILGTSILVLGFAILYGINETAFGLFISIYPILAYLYLVSVSSKFYKSKSNSYTKLGVVILVISLVFVIGVMSFGLKESKIQIVDSTLVIEGMYGEKLPFETIASAQLINELPEISYKSNGFALGETRKGYFKLANGEQVKLFTSDEEGQLVELVTQTNEKIIVQLPYTSARELVQEINKQ